MGVEFTYLRPKKAQHLKEWVDNELVVESISVESYKNAVILPLKNFQGDELLFGRGGAVSASGDYIKTSAIEGRVQFAYEYTDFDLIEERVVYGGYFVHHWGHFLIESVARLWYALEEDDGTEQYVFFVESNAPKTVGGNYKEFFELLGIWGRVKIINKPTKFKEVVIPELAYKRMCAYSPLFKQIFHTVAKKACDNQKESKAYKKIFFTRSQLKSAKKSDVGLEVLDSYFRNNGYEIIAPEKISLSEMVFLIRKAEIVATVSGTLPHNMLFGEDEKKLLILERNILNNEIQVDINKIKKLNVTYIDANYGIYSIYVGRGPFFMTYRGRLEQYTINHSMLPPDTKYISEKYNKKCFKEYMKIYRKRYAYEWAMDEYANIYIDYLREAYYDSLKHVGKYLSGQKAFRMYHYFQIKYIKNYAKQFIKRMMRK